MTPEKNSRDIESLAAGVRSFRIECERFFNGALPMPPEGLRDEVHSLLRRLRERPGLNHADRFRVNQLEARFNSYIELFNRRLREQEEGRRRAGIQAQQEESRFDLARGVEVGPSVGEEVVEALYAGLCRSAGSPRFDLDSFRSYLEEQNAAIRAKTGCSRVRFRLATEGGRTKLKVKPLEAG